MHQLKAALLQDSNMVVPGKHLNGLVVGNKHEDMATSIMDTMGMWLATIPSHRGCLISEPRQNTREMKKKSWDT